MDIDLKPLFEDVGGNTIITIDTVTTPRLKGGAANTQQGLVTKVVLGSNVMVFSNTKSNGYENMVKRRLLKEGKNPETFRLIPRKWGTRVPRSPIVEHKGSQYLEVIFLRSGSVQYLLNGTPVGKDQIVGLDEPEPSNEAQGGLQRQVQIRCYKVDSIKRLKINGKEYKND